MYCGSWKIDDLLTFTVNTHTPSTGAETDADSLPTYRIYEDETGTAILTGSMALLDDANTVGHYSEQITLSAANGFEKGKSYNIRIRGIVGGVAGATTRTFQIEAEVDANVVSDSRMDELGAANLPADIDQIKADLPARITKNTALAAFEFFMVDSADHITGKTGLTVTATRSIDGAAFASCANAVAEVANGIYKIDLAAADLNGNVITLKFTATGADARLITIVTQVT